MTTTGAWAQSFPDHAVALVVPYPPGGSADVLARSIGKELSTRINQPVLVENRAGAGTAIGARYVAEARPDGYTMLMGTVSSQAINPAMTRTGYDPLRDFVAIAPIASIPFALVVPPDSPFKSLADVIAEARRNPGKVGYASAGPGTSNHLAGELLASGAKIHLLHVPYRGSAPALTDVLAGHVPMMFDLLTTSIPEIRAGKLKALAVTSAQRSSLLPDVPTVAELGQPGFDVTAWFGLFAPAKTPAAAVQALSAATRQVIASPEMKQRLQQLGATPDERNLSQFSAYVESEVRKYGDVVKAARLSSQ